MNNNLSMNAVEEVLASIRESLLQANMAVEGEGDAGWAVQGPYVRMRILLEAAGLVEALNAVQQMETTARDNWARTEFDQEAGEPYLVWGAKLYQYLVALEVTLGKPKATIVMKDVIQILRGTQYSITDKSCFQNPPANESDVHSRVEAVLRCVFPDLLHKPPIAKQIKNFQPDTGLPSIGTLIEYKFMADQGEEKRIADEILADTRGYISKDWKQYIYVIYETKRIKPESQWRQLLRESEIKADTEIIVISGEEPTRPVEAIRTPRLAR
jgi:REase_DpnII-MboI